MQNNKTIFQYNQVGLIEQRIDAANGKLQYYYDRLGRLEVLINELEQKFYFSYDQMSRLVQQQDFEQQITNFTYAPGGILQQSESKGKVSKFAYDNMRRLTTATYQYSASKTPTEVEQYAYDKLGRPVQAKNSACRQNWHYDAVGNLVEESTSYQMITKPWLARWQHQYDALNNRIATVRPDGRVQQWLTYGSGHIHGMLLDGVELIGFQRDDLHRETTRSLANQLLQHKSYDDAGRLASLKVVPGEKVPAAMSKDFAQITRQYSYDPLGQLSKISDNQRNEITYQHDPLGRLIAANGTLSTDTKEIFKFDPASNLLATANENDFRIKEEFDGWGNTKATRKFPEQPVTIEWDFHGRIKKTHLLLELENHYVNVNYYYDLLGRRLAKCSDSLFFGEGHESYYRVQERQINAKKDYGITLFAWDGDTMAFEYSVRNQEIKHYFYEPGSFIPMLQVRATQWGRKKDRSPGFDQVAYYHCDHLGTPQEMTDATGKIVWSARYAAFGRAHVSPNSTYSNNIRFQGQYEDRETGLHYNYHRYYNPERGRYLSKDPIGLAGGVNLRGYVKGMPNVYVDPRGLDWFRPDGHGYAAGRKGSIVEPGEDIGWFLDDWLPAGHTFATMHDSLVDILIENGVPDWLSNIPTMIPTYAVAVGTESVNTVSKGLNYAIDGINNFFDSKIPKIPKIADPSPHITDTMPKEINKLSCSN